MLDCLTFCMVILGIGALVTAYVLLTLPDGPSTTVCYSVGAGGLVSLGLGLVGLLIRSKQRPE